LKYQSKAINYKFKSDLSIVCEVKVYKLAECFLFLQLVLHELKTEVKVPLYGLTDSHEVNGITAPVILNLGTKYRLFIFMTRPLYSLPPGKNVPLLY
jgi:hypothetical protein